MGYYINPSEMMGMFPVPNSVIDKHLKLADAIHLKVLLWFLRNPAANYDTALAAETLKIDEICVTEGLAYWVNAGILMSTEKPKQENETKEKKTEAKKVIKAALKPDRDEVARRGLECKEIAFLLSECEKQFGRLLKPTEASTLVWLYDNQGISLSLIMMIVGYAAAEGKINIGFIERTAVEWVNNGIDNVIAAEERLVEMRRKNSAWHIVQTAMGIEHRRPSATELELADKWVNDWKYGRDILRAAYDACVDATSKFSIPYIKKILAEWHKTGVKTVEDIKKLTSKPTDSKPENKPQKRKSGKSSENGDSYQDFVNSIILKIEGKD